MKLNLNSVMMGTKDSKKLAEFYTKMLGKKADWSEGDWYGWQAGKTFLTVGKHSKIKGKTKEPERVILNFETKEVKKEFARLKRLGAKVIKEPYEMDGGMVATLADQDGNFVQLMTPWK